MADVDTGFSTRNDLALVLPQACFEPVEATEVSPAWQAVAAMLDDAQAPALLGIERLSIQAARAAHAWAHRHQAKLLFRRYAAPWPFLPRVSRHATLGHAIEADMLIWVGTHGMQGPIEQFLAEYRLLASFVDDTLSTVQRLRAVFRDNPKAEPVGRHNRVALVLAPDIDPRVACQWHDWANEMQDHVRVSVVALPGPDAWNRRGVTETLTWLTGIAPGVGLDYAGGKPTPTRPWDELLKRGALDFVIDLTATALPTEANPRPTHVAMGRDAPEGCDVHLPIEPLRWGRAAQVMRCDAVPLWLCDNPASAPDDPMVAVLDGL